MKEYIKDGYVVTQYESPAEMRDRVAANLPADGGELSLDSYFLGREFTSKQELLSAVDLPWPEGMEAVEDYRKRIDEGTTRAVSVKRKRRFIDDGEDIDVNRYIASDPMYRSTVRRQKNYGNRNIKLICHCGGVSSVSSDEMFIRTAAVVATADILEDAGYSCEIVMYYRSMNVYRTSNYQGIITVIQLKKFGEPINVNNLIVAMSPWLFRSVHFEQRRQYDPRNITFGLGRTTVGMQLYEEHFDVGGCEWYEFPYCITVDHAVAAAKELINKIESKI